jgi:hypothetical protein
VLLALSTVIHYEVLRMLTARLPALDIQPRAKLIVVIFGTFLAHTAEIVLYAVAVYILVRYLDAGTLGDASHFSLTQCLYFSSETYSSLGYGDIVPGGPLRMLAGVEVLNGLLLIGWSASYTYIAMERFWSDAGEAGATATARTGAAAGRAKT